jgi:hypothetical protein
MKSNFSAWKLGLCWHADIRVCPVIQYLHVRCFLMLMAPLFVGINLGIYTGAVNRWLLPAVPLPLDKSFPGVNAHLWLMCCRLGKAAIKV